MSLYFLSSNDFTLAEGELRQKHSRQEFTLVFFFSPDCRYCGPVGTIVKQLAASIQGCKFALVNVRENYALSQQSRQTSTPITYVPLLILYYGGRPYQKFTDAPTLQNLQNFILEASHRVKTQFAAKPIEKQVPAYTVGIPYCDEDTGVCYLDFNAAYKGGTAPRS